MRNKIVNFLLGMIAGIIATAVIAVFTFYPIRNCDQILNELEVRIDSIEEHIVEETTFTIISEPRLLFQFLDMSPEWEEIEAVPYSKCYRHLQGSTTPMVADYIMCQAI